LLFQSDDYEVAEELSEAEKAAFQKHYEELKTDFGHQGGSGKEAGEGVATKSASFGQG
jgi:hypothetical protein